MRSEEALALLDEARRVNPLSPSIEVNPPDSSEAPRVDTLSPSIRRDETVMERVSPSRSIKKRDLNNDSRIDQKREIYKSIQKGSKID